MICPHCGKEITKTVLLCPFCYTHEQVECICEGGGAYQCHSCNKQFQAYNGYYHYDEGKGKKRMGKIAFIEVPFEWRSFY